MLIWTWMGDAAAPVKVVSGWFWSVLGLIRLDRVESFRLDCSQTKMRSHSPPGHALFTVLGTAPRSLRYSLAGERVEAQLAPIALLELLPEERRPDEIVAFCTPQSMRDSFPLLEASAGIPVRGVEIPEKGNESELEEILGRMAEAVPSAEDAELTLDVTHGPRHLQFLLFTVARFLSSLRGTKIRALYYARMMGDGDAAIVDLGNLLILQEWIHAVEEFRRSGDVRAIVGILGRNARGQDQERLVRELQELGDAYMWALPLEVGKMASYIRKQRLRSLRRWLKEQHRIPLVDDLVAQLRSTLMDLEFGNSSQEHVLGLDVGELERQARLLEDRYRRGDRGQVALLLHEWVLSWAMWAQGETGDWIDYHKRRRPVASKLDLLGDLEEGRKRGNRLTEAQADVGKLWKRLSLLRNWFAHAGLRKGFSIRDANDLLEEVFDLWRKRLRSLPRVSLEIGSPSGILLVSPLGLNPGVLSAAVAAASERELRPTGILVVGSNESRRLLEAELAQWQSCGNIEFLELRNPRTGTQEIEQLAKEAERHILGAEKILVNVTGGTTVMGLAVASILDRAAKLSKPIVRFGVAEVDESGSRDGVFWLDEQA